MPSAIRFASHRQVAEQAALRPPRYLLDLERVIVRRDEHGIWYDAARPAFLELVRKYRPAPRTLRPASGLSTAEAHWQAWREEGGRWVPDGWIKPGFYADPPAFDPLLGERLSTPGFPAAEFAAPVSTEPVDVVIPLGRGSRLDDAELRLALRSIERYVENLGKVWIVGHRPAWVRGVKHIPAGDPSRIKDANILAKIEMACRAGVSERFLRWSDDQVLLRPLAWSQFGPYTWGDLTGKPANGKRWHRRLLATRDWLAVRGLPTFHCDTHVPAPMERAKFLELADRARDAWETGDGVTAGTWYCNQAGTPQPVGDRKATIEAGLPSAEIRSRLAGRWFVGFNDQGFSGDVRALLGEVFPEPSRFELPPAIRVKSAGPALSVIIPTIGRPSLKRTLESIAGQELAEGDEVLVVQDGPSDLAVWAAVKASGLPVRYLATGKRANDFGGTPRNLGMQHARGDYLAFMDDDDTYRPGAFATIRRAIARHPGRPLMFRMERPGWKPALWRQAEVRHGNVSTQMFVTPNHPDLLGTWQSYQAGDLAFLCSTLELYLSGSLVWEPEIIATVPQANTSSIATCPRRNLIYHVYPVAANEDWRLNVQRLRDFWPVFNGRKIVGIACDDVTDPPEAVREAFPDEDIEWLIFPNDRTGERPTFTEGLRRLKSYDARECTFYAHTKGVSPHVQERGAVAVASVRRWRELMYRGCLGDLRRVDWAVNRYAAAGCLRTHKALFESSRPADWHFSGTFFWVNHARFFAIRDAGEVVSRRHGVERHLGELFAHDEVYCFAGDHPREQKRKYLWTSKDWDRVEGRSCDTPSTPV